MWYNFLLLPKKHFPVTVMKVIPRFIQIIFVQVFSWKYSDNYNVRISLIPIFFSASIHLQQFIK